MAKTKLIARDDISDILAKTDGTPVVLFGPPGTGKTTVAQRSFDKMGSGFYSWTFTEQQSAAAGWGHYIPKGTTMDWHHGPFAMAWIQGKGLILNEINHASEDVSNSLHALLDNVEVAQITLPTGDTIKPAKGFRVIATMNGLPAMLHPAVNDRLALRIMVTEPSEEMIWALAPELRDYCVKAYQSADPERGPEITYRDCLTITGLIAGGKFPMNLAVGLVVPNPSAATALAEALTVAKTKVKVA